MRVKSGKPPLDEPDEDSIEEGETLSIHLYTFWEAFAVLSRTRTVTEAGPQPITVAEINSYCDLLYIIDSDIRADTLYHITNLDIEWLKHSYDQIEKAREKAKKEAEKAAKAKSRKR